MRLWGFGRKKSHGHPCWDYCITIFGALRVVGGEGTSATGTFQLLPFPSLRHLVEGQVALGPTPKVQDDNPLPFASLPPILGVNPLTSTPSLTRLRSIQGIHLANFPRLRRTLHLPRLFPIAVATSKSPPSLQTDL